MAQVTESEPVRYAFNAATMEMAGVILSAKMGFIPTSTKREHVRLLTAYMTEARDQWGRQSSADHLPAGSAEW